MKRGHWIKSARTETLVGIALMVAGAVLLHDAFERRAKPQPFWLKPFTWW